MIQKFNEMSPNSITTEICIQLQALAKTTGTSKLKELLFNSIQAQLHKKEEEINLHQTKNLRKGRIPARL